MERERGGRVKVIDYLLVATAKNLQNENIIKKKTKKTDDAGYAAAFSAFITSRPWRKNI